MGNETFYCDGLVHQRLWISRLNNDNLYTSSASLSGLFCCIFFILEDSNKIIEYSIKDANTNKKQQIRYTSIFFM